MNSKHSGSAGGYRHSNIQNVYSNFTKFIPAGESEFTIDNPNNVRDGIERAFSFGHLELVPEYVSEAAEVEEMDDEEANKNEIIHTVRIGVNYLEEFYYPEDHRKRMLIQFPKGRYYVADIMKALNHGFEAKKPLGMSICPGFFDWKITALDPFKEDGAKFREKTEAYAVSYYDELSDFFSPNTHKGWLPPTINTGPFNDFKLPSNDTILSDTRCRMVLLPKFKMAFSNSQLLLALGFSPDFIGKRKKHNQYVIVNDSPMHTSVMTGEKAPLYRVDLLHDLTVHLSISVKSNPIMVQVGSSVVEAKRVTELVEKLNTRLGYISTDTYGYDLGVKVNTAGKVEFDVPSNEVIEFELTTTDRFLKILGFPPGRPITASNNEGKAVVFDRTNINPEEGLAFSSILVLDTGPLTVTLKDCPSLLTRGRTDQVMAFLRANGSVSAMIQNMDPPALFPSKQHTLTFKIDRHSDKSEIIGLSWPVGCYAHGVLVGRPLNGTPI